MQSLKSFKATVPKPLRQVTLCFLLKENKILLALKKRGFGQGKWNGVGGKPNPRESIEEAAIRETQEEIGVTPLELQQVAKMSFYFPFVPIDKNWNQQVVVFICRKWEGKEIETEEMKPKWFDIDALPFDEMWSVDGLWLPEILKENKIEAEFLYDEHQNALEYRIRKTLKKTI